MKYQVGDRVRIVSEWGSGCHQNRDGAMDGWLGQVMTIKSVGSDWYCMEEDSGLWAWWEPAIAGYADSSAFKKSNLRSGDVVECQNGGQYIVMLNCGDPGSDVMLGLEHVGFMPLASYRNDLTYVGSDPSWGIVKVWRAKVYNIKFKPANMELIYERKAVKVLTMGEAIEILNEHFGEQVEIQ